MKIIVLTVGKNWGDVMKLEEQIKRVIEEQLHVKIRHDGETLEDMCADSLDMVELANTLEEQFNIVIDDKDLTLDLAVRDIIRLVKKGVELS